MRVNSAAAARSHTSRMRSPPRWSVGRFYFRIHQNVSATSDILTLKNVNGAVYLRMLTTRVIRLTFSGTTNYAGPTLSLDTWYRIDFRADCTGAMRGRRLEGQRRGADAAQLRPNVGQLHRHLARHRLRRPPATCTSMTSRSPTCRGDYPLGGISKSVTAALASATVPRRPPPRAWPSRRPSRRRPARPTARRSPSPAGQGRQRRRGDGHRAANSADDARRPRTSAAALASGTVSALAPAHALATGAGVASGTVTATHLIPGSELVINAGLASGTVTAYNPTIMAGKLVAAGVATGT